MSTSTEVTRYTLLNIVAARGQEVCVAYVNGQDLSGRVEGLFGALSKLQEFDDRHADDGPASPQEHEHGQ